MSENVLAVLMKRGFIEAVTGDELHSHLLTKQKIYCGFDPTGDSLHLGHLIPIIGLAWFQRYGHETIAVVGGATGMIGDPSGKKSERQLLDTATIQENVKGIAKNLKDILEKNCGGSSPQLLNNADWFNSITFIDFLRDIGKQFRLSTMLAKDSVKLRLQSEEGMSFTEFCYQLLQSYDFLYLYKNHAVSIQLGGSDQWGNITAGIELIRKELAAPTYGITFPLLTRSDGQKFGKSEKGAIWLSSDKLSPYEFYQYLYRIPDEDVIKLMRLLTFMELEEIERYEKLMKAEEYQVNSAQKRLAEEVTRIVHGEAGVELALRATQSLAPGSSAQLDKESLAAIASDIPTCQLQAELVIGLSIIDLFVAAKLCSSKGEVRRLIKQGGAYLNNNKCEDELAIISEGDLIEGSFLLLSAGKKNKVLVTILI